jgi:hypothetical protein
MSVQINYKGRCGNNIFQYVTARIFSEKNGLNLNQDLNCDLLKTTPHKNSQKNIGNSTIRLNNGSFINNELPYQGDYNYVFDDFFQNCVYINDNKDMVKNFFDLPKIEKNLKDIVLHIRLDDKVHSNNLNNPEDWSKAEIMHPDYYTSILDKEIYEKVYIVVDNIKYGWEKKYISYFDKYNPIIVSKTPYEDFHFIRSFNKIITSTSTYSYWSAFLSDAEKIYTFKKAGYFGNPIRSHGDHVKELWNIKNQSTPIDEKFYFGE